MNQKKAKKLRRLANHISAGQTKEKTEMVYKRLKTTYKETKGK